MKLSRRWLSLPTAKDNVKVLPKLNALGFWSEIAQKIANSMKNKQSNDGYSQPTPFHPGIFYRLRSDNFYLTRIRLSSFPTMSGSPFLFSFIDRVKAAKMKELFIHGFLFLCRYSLRKPRTQPRVTELGQTSGNGLSRNAMT